MLKQLDVNTTFVDEKETECETPNTALKREFNFEECNIDDDVISYKQI